MTKLSDIKDDNQIADKPAIEELKRRLKKDLEFMKDESEGILLYGSWAKNSANQRSDIDICIIKPRTNELLKRIFQKLGDRYDPQFLIICIVLEKNGKI